MKMAQKMAAECIHCPAHEERPRMVSTTKWLLLTALLFSAAPASDAFFGGKSKDTDQPAAPVDDHKYYW